MTARHRVFVDHFAWADASIAIEAAKPVAAAAQARSAANAW
jgi:hypothetical protein